MQVKLGYVTIVKPGRTALTRDRWEAEKLHEPSRLQEMRRYLRWERRGRMLVRLGAR